MDNYIMKFYLDNGDEVSTHEFKADSYQAVFENFYKVDDQTRLIILELGTDSIFIPVSKICRMKVINLTVAEKEAIKNFF
ncbi:hypothetical protein ACIQ6U_09620 [Lysinibacillus fusiformis]|uniref:hypothetical protein n=1 Tax=Lysinibacillus fusiformis TaxID=28031 RepID=UPI00380D096C